MSLELVSFVICPFVQRAIIVLSEKEVPFEITYVDIDEPPEWFSKISPFGKVPLLKVDGDVLFESAIINEYLDEVFMPRLHPDAPLERAKQRGWIEFGSNLFFEQVGLLLAKNADEYQQKKEGLAAHSPVWNNNWVMAPIFRVATFHCWMRPMRPCLCVSTC